MDIKTLKKIKKKLENGDREIIASLVPCSLDTLDKALKGERNGIKSRKAIKETIKYLKEKEQQKKLADELINL